MIREDSRKETDIMDTDMELPREEKGMTDMDCVDIEWTEAIRIDEKDCSDSEWTEAIRIDEKESDIMSMDSISRELNEIIRKKASFGELPVSVRTMKGIENTGFKPEKMTKFQATAIPCLLQGKDAMVVAGMCPRKYLAIMIPAVELLYQEQFTPQKGTGAIFICATPLEAAWVYLIARDLLKYHLLTPGLVCGYTSCSEEEQILKGVNLLVTTPEHLLKHLQNTQGFIYENLKFLMIDNVDRILEFSFEEEMRKIISILPKIRQTLISSTTQSMKVRDLARLSLRTTSVLIEVAGGQKRAVAAASSKNRKKTEGESSNYRRKRHGVGKNLDLLQKIKKTEGKSSKCKTKKGWIVLPKRDVLRKINIYGWRIMRNPKKYGL